MTRDNGSPRNRLERERNTIQELAESGEFPQELADRLIELSEALDKENPRKKYVDPDGERKEYASGTVFQYINIIKRWYELSGTDFITASTDDVNKLAADMDTGQHPESPEGGYSRQTVNKFLCAAKAFYHYHSDLEPSHGEIEIFKKKNNPAYDSRDMFTREEINQLRDAMENPRHRALLEMLIFTGQRIRAILTLRVKDFDLEEGYFYLNDEVDGLKGATKRGLKRPLFGAREYVRDWLEYHPRGDDPEAWVFIGDPSNPRVDLDNPITERSVIRILRNAAEKADIQKKVSPHKFRHYFVTVMKRDYDMNDDTIKFLLGHAEGSNVMNTTYKHVKNEDYIEKAEVATGAKEPDNQNPHVPPACPVCGEVLEPDWKSCPKCGEVFTPDAKDTEEQLERDVRESYQEADSMDKVEKVQVLDDVLEDAKDDPELKAALIEKLSEE